MWFVHATGLSVVDTNDAEEEKEEQEEEGKKNCIEIHA